jgi:hypothetical protein
MYLLSLVLIERCKTISIGHPLKLFRFLSLLADKKVNCVQSLLSGCIKQGGSVPTYVGPAENLDTGIPNSQI